MIKKTVYKTLSEFEQARQQKFVVGSSTIPTILGADKYKTPLQLYDEVVAQFDGGNMVFDDNPALTRGHFAENAVAQWFEATTGRKVVKKTAEIAVYTNDKYPDCQASPDRELFANGAAKRPILECKDTLRHISATDLDELPAEWYLQIQWQMGIMERDSAVIAICDGAKTLQYREFAFDAILFEQAMAGAKKFIAAVRNRIPPEPISGDDIQALYPQPTELAKEVPITVADAVTRYRAKKAAIRTLTEECDALADAIKVACGDAAEITYNGVPLATYKAGAKGRRLVVR